MSGKFIKPTPPTYDELRGMRMAEVKEIADILKAHPEFPKMERELANSIVKHEKHLLCDWDEELKRI